MAASCINLSARSEINTASDLNSVQKKKPGSESWSCCHDKDEIKQSVKMSEILSRYGLKPNRAGFICCPFHKEKSASCKIYDDSFYCFGCGIGGDVFDFVMQYESVPFSTAFIELGGTYVSKKGKSRNQIRHEVRDIKSKNVIPLRILTRLSR